MPDVDMNLQSLWILSDLNDDGEVDEFDLDLAFAQYGFDLSVVS